jgi:glycerol-3-phosphate dehydrogenase subunit C
MNPETGIVDRSDRCIKCGICTAYCPVARVTGDFLGPKQAGPDAQRFRRSQDPLVDLWVGLCIGCGTCDLMCPAGVNVSELTLLAKVKARDEQGFSLRNWLLGHPDFFDPLAAALSPVINRVMRNRLFRWLSDRLLGIDRRRPFPVYEKQTFRQWFRRHRSKGFRKVAYFYGCYTNTHEMDVGTAVVDVLERSGFEVLLPEQVCCGVPLLGQGDPAGARELGMKNVESLSQIVEAGYDIVFSSTTCGHMIRCEYPELLEIEGADRVSARTFDVCEYLMMAHERGDLNTDFGFMKKRLPYHVPCHLRSMGIGLPALELLRLIPGLEVEDIDAGCCGLGGTYGFKRETYDVSMAIGQNVVRSLKEFGSPVVISDCEGCRMQIRQLTGLKAVHPVQVLRDAYRINRRKTPEVYSEDRQPTAQRQ